MVLDPSSTSELGITFNFGTIPKLPFGLSSTNSSLGLDLADAGLSKLCVELFADLFTTSESTRFGSLSGGDEGLGVLVLLRLPASSILASDIWLVFSLVFVLDLVKLSVLLLVKLIVGLESRFFLVISPFLDENNELSESLEVLASVLNSLSRLCFFVSLTIAGLSAFLGVWIGLFVDSLDDVRLVES